VVASAAIRFLPRPSPLPITLRAEPAEVKLSYRVGVGEHLPSQIIDFKSAGVKFEVSPTDDWLTVAPHKGDRLGRLEVRVTKDLKVGIYTDKLIVHADGAANAPFTIPVRLTVEAVEAPPPVQLKLEREEVKFTYTQNGATPGPESIRAKQGVIGSATHIQNWLQLTHTTKGVSVSLSPEQLQQLGSGDQGDIVTVVPADGGEPVQVKVRLHVSAPKVAQAPKDPLKKEDANPGLTTSPQPPPSLPLKGPGCDTGPFGGDQEDSFTFAGNLEAGAAVEIQSNRAVVVSGVGAGSVRRGAPPNRRALRISRVEPEGIVAAERVPNNDNQCLPLLIKVGKAAIRTFTVYWELDSRR
jgi:hypothetical protein